MYVYLIFISEYHHLLLFINVKPFNLFILIKLNILNGFAISEVSCYNRFILLPCYNLLITN